jgi:alkylation response protein AidB-like acyl-CoA dehydrogenase
MTPTPFGTRRHGGPLGDRRRAGTPSVTYKFIDKMGHRLAANAELVFDNARVPADNLLEGAEGNGDLVINRNFASSGPVAGTAVVGVARAAYETALDWAKSYTAGGPKPIIHYGGARDPGPTPISGRVDALLLTRPARAPTTPRRCSRRGRGTSR